MPDRVSICPDGEGTRERSTPTGRSGGTMSRVPAPPSWKPDPVASVVVEDLGTDVCLFRAAEEVLVLNRTASDVWRLCGRGLDVTEVVRQLELDYQQPSGTLTADIEAALLDLAARGYLTPPDVDPGDEPQRSSART
jgi:hypothetical protein